VPYEYLDLVTSDVTFEARAESLDELFTAAVDATTNVMVESLESVRPLVTKAVELAAPALDLLLMRLLDTVVFYKDAECLLLRAARVRVDDAVGGPSLRGELVGEAIDRSRHALAGDVKAVTLQGLLVERAGAGWRARVTLDV
jgi:SHS2 domain-containing protein